MWSVAALVAVGAASTSVTTRGGGASGGGGLPTGVVHITSASNDQVTLRQVTRIAFVIQHK
jgi:hypothetical protein